MYLTNSIRVLKASLGHLDIRHLLGTPFDALGITYFATLHAHACLLAPNPLVLIGKHT